MDRDRRTVGAGGWPWRGWTRPGLIRLLTASQWVIGLVAVAYAISTVTWARDESGFSVLLEGWLINGLLVAAAGLCLARPALVREERLAWLALGVGLTVWTSGDIYWTLFVQPLDQAPFPSPADWLWLAFYPFAYVAVVLLIRARVRRFHPSVWLDGVTGGLGVAALGAALAFGPIVRATGGSSAAVAVGLASPLADLLLLALVVGALSLTGWHVDRQWRLLGAGLVMMAVADTIFLFREATGTYRPGTPLDALWPGAIVLMALSAWRRPTRAHLLRLEGWRVLVLPFLFALAALAVLVYDHYRQVNALAVYLAAATLVTAGVRTAFTFREVRALAESRVEARTDDLTGLGNRRLLLERLKGALEARRPEETVALLLIDLDRFKEVNDSLGHDVGDQLLREIGPRLSAGLRASDVVARIGGDEFALLLGPGADAAYAQEVAWRIQTELEAPLLVGGVRLHIAASCGIVLCPDHATDAAGLLRRADVAMYQAKAARTGVEVYVPDRDHHSLERLKTMEELRLAVELGQLELHYQPKAELATGQVRGVEALVRWRHPERGLLYPDAFLELAELTGLMGPLTRSVLAMALAQCRAWRDAGLGLSVAVNLSTTSLLDPTLPAQVAAMLEEAGVAPTSLVLEITEGTLMADPHQARVVLSDLQNLGVRIAVDDYGTGYSSLAYLRHLPIHELKLDRAFITDLGREEGAVAIVRSTIDLAHSLGLEIVAEGVEDQLAWFILSDLGCDIAQGYFLSRPVTAPALEDWLRARRDESSEALRPAI